MKRLFKINNNHLINSIRLNSSYYKISKLSQNTVGECIEIKGWIKGLRKMKEYIFLDINDGSCSKNLQIVINNKPNPNLCYGASIEAKGILSTSLKGQPELKTENFSILGTCPITDGFPFTPRQTYPPEYIREYLHLRPRVNTFCSLLRFRHNATRAFNNYLSDQDFIQIHTPLITANDCEGAGEIFKIQPLNEKILKQMVKQNVPLDEAFFDKKTFLTVSGQLHLEAMASGLGNVYTFGPTFRAENSKSPVHLSEFYMLEAEQCFITSIDNVTKLIEDMTKKVTTTLLDNSEADIINCHQNKQLNLENEFQWINKTFPIITYKEAIEILKKYEKQLKSPVNIDDGLTKDQELFLTKHMNSPLFIIDWPTKMKPFYMRQKSNNRNLVEGVDFLVPFIGELAGGSVREDNYNLLKNKIPSTDLNWYLELRKFGGITTGGFGLGFDRYIQFILNIVNIRDVIPFPRWAHNCHM